MGRVQEMGLVRSRRHLQVGVVVHSHPRREIGAAFLEEGEVEVERILVRPRGELEEAVCLAGCLVLGVDLDQRLLGLRHLVVD